jgi:hypothetical protein
MVFRAVARGFAVVLASACAASPNAGVPTSGPGGAGGGGGATRSSASTGGSGGAGEGGAGGVVDAGRGDADGADGGPAETTRCEPKFPYQDEPDLGTWLGGDSAFSLPLSSTQSLWTFQDSFVAGHGQTTRAGAGLVAGTMALAECRGGAYTIRYFWRVSGATRKAIFDDGNTMGERFWSHQPWLHAGALYATLTVVRNDATAPLGFLETGTKLARVANPFDLPTSWSVEYLELATLPALGKGVAVQGGFVYLYGPYQNDLVLARLPLEGLGSSSAPSSLLQYLAADGTWKPGLVPADARKMGLAANTGLTLRFHSGRAKWLALFTDTRQFPSPNVALSSASSLEGPWSAPAVVYGVPEMSAVAPGFDADTFCYAAYEHPEWNADATRLLGFTYTCNSRSFAKLVANLDIYLPRVVSLAIP